MDEYIKKSEAVDVIVKYPYDIAGKTATAIRMIESLPSADVVPKSEVDLYRKQVDELEDELASTYDKLENAKAEIETLKDNNEHLAVMLEEAKAEVGKLQNELVIWKQNRFNLFQRLECYEMARQKVASEIFAEIEKEIDRGLSVIEKILNTKSGRANGKTVLISKYDVYREAKKYIAELKKKYTEGEQ